METRLVLVLVAITTLATGVLFLIGGEVNSSLKSSDGQRLSILMIVILLLQVVTLTLFSNLATRPCSRELMRVNPRLTTTVLNETKAVDGIDTRIVEERAVNTKTGHVFEVSRNYFAICKETNSTFYFGEISTGIKMEMLSIIQAIGYMELIMLRVD